MKMRIFNLLALFLFSFAVPFSVIAQVMDPNDPVIEYTGGTVQQPVSGQVGDWVKTTRLNWNTSEFKAYIYKGNIFRLKFPKSYQHNVNDGKTYPLFIFFHGIGESADENLYDNEYQLFHGGQTHQAAVNNGKFDGFLLYMQNQYGFFGTAHYDAIAEIIQNFLVPQNKLDINRIYVDGLSGGGNATWEFTLRYPTLVTAALPISAALNSYNTSANINILKYIPIWHFQGALDKNPNPGVSEALGSAILAAGGPYKYTKYPTRGHSCWNDAWAEPDFYDFMLRAHKANPVALFGKYEFCVGENVNVTLGISAGFNGYQWRKNGTIIQGATSNTLVIQGTQAATFGTYECRFLRGSTWSPWSPKPIIIKLKDVTITPPIQTRGLMSRAIPSPDGKTSVTLSQPEGYVSYSWSRQGTPGVLGTADSLVTSTPGTYFATVTEPFGCQSQQSPAFIVVNSNGPNKPDAVKNAILTPTSLNQIKIDWTDNPYSQFNETNFEIYQSTKSGGPYQLIGITGQDATTFTANNLASGTKYYYVIRAINNTGASPLSQEVGAVALRDDIAPAAPGNLRITASTTNSVTLAWNSATDNVGIFAYDILINGIKSYSTTGTTITCYNLSAADSGYAFVVKARDNAGNSSAPSNQVNALIPSNVAPVPAAPTNLVATAVSYKRINLTWNDNSNNETGFEILRSTNPVSGFSSIGVVAANTTSYGDSIGLNSSTTYYYRISAVYPYGSSNIQGDAEANWKFNNNYADAGTGNKGLSASGSPTFDAVEKREGSHSVRFNGTNQYVNVNTAPNDYLQGVYSQKSIAFWMKSNSNTGNRIVVDLGGSDDGIAVRLDANTLYAGIAANSTRRSISTPYNNTNWNHVAVVYFGNTLRLYLNGNLVASNLNLGFTTTTTTTNGSRIGALNSSNAFNTGSGFFNGWIDNFGIFSTPLSAADIANLMNNVSVSATTLASASVPATPTTLLANATGTSANLVTWSDNASNEISYKLYKSDNNNLNYVLLATLPANTTSYTDNGLFANSIRYYKVLASNSTGNSSFSNEDSSKTWPNVPFITTIANKYMRFGSQLQVDVKAQSPLNGNLTLNVTNLPSFGSFTPTGNGTGVITFNNPTQGQQGTYPNITISATDPFGSGSTSFQLVVNSNYNPVLQAINDVTIDENQSVQINLAASDNNPEDVLAWQFADLPSFVTSSTNGSGAVLNIAPGFANHGTYPVTVVVNDGNNGLASRSFVITVNDINPNQKIYVNFGDASAIAGTPWNNTAKVPALNDNFSSFKDHLGNTTSVGIQITSPWGQIGNGTNLLGVNTGNNSGVYPDVVMQSAYWTDANSQTLRLYGLDPSRIYNFTLFGSRANFNDDRTSVYTIKGVSAALNTANNSQNTALLQNIQPEADGTLDLTLQRGANNTTFAYLNALVIEKTIDDNTPPAKPRNFSLVLNGNSSRLSWIDAAYNETAYFIYRSEDPNGGFELLNPTGNNPNTQQYDDGSVGGNQTYYYFIKAINNFGSNNSDTLAITTGNGTPLFNTIANVSMHVQETVNVNLTVTDDPGDLVTITATNLPQFVTLTDNGDGSGVLKIAPGSVVGIYNNITVTATDEHGASSSKTFKIVVRDVFKSIYVNFSNTTAYPAPSPWNSFTSVPFANKSLTNMIDDTETPSGVSITQVDTWEGAVDQGAITGDNTGIFPDNVMKTVYYQSSGVPMRVRISGLNKVDTKYNLVFFASRLAGDNRTTIYSANGQSVSLNAANNTSQTVQLNGLVPDANGVIEFTCNKGAGSPYAYLGAVVIQSYIDNGLPPTPANLTAVATSKTAIRLNWSDKSADEDGFVIERATTFNGPYTEIFTTATGVTTYLDATGLKANTAYYYRVRAKKANAYSGYSNVATTSTFVYSVMINFNRTNNASAPWNNTARAPEEGRVFTNLRNELNNVSGLSMTIVDNFSGDNPSGMITGNNSGVYPDNVLRSSWWVDVGVTSKLKISGLNQNMRYTFVFCGSRNGDGNRTSVYSIGGSSVSLNASFNISQTVQLNDVRPDENGEVYVTVSLAQYAMFAYLNAMVINAYKVGELGDPDATLNQPLKAFAGNDKQMTLPTNTVQLAGNGIDGNGTTYSYNWSKLSGPDQYSIDNSSISNPTISNLVAGTYTFRLTVTDNLGASATDDVIVLVNPAPANTPPTANAGTDKQITLPTNSIQLTGSASDLEGGTLTYSWTKIAGPAQFTITNGNSLTPTVGNLAEGTYTFRLTVTDNQGTTGTDDVNVVVAPPTGPRVINVNMTGGLNPYNNSEWNNWNSVASWNSQVLNYSDGVASGVTGVLSNQQGMSDNGATYTTTMVASAVARYASYSTLNRTLTLSGLNPSKTYTLEIYASRSGAGPNVTRFTVNGNSIDIDAANNSANAAVFNSVAPSASGQIVLNLARLNTYNYINGFKLTEEGSGQTRTMRSELELASNVLAVEQAKGFNVNPNPFRDYITVSTEFTTDQSNLSVRMIDMMGRVVVNQYIGHVQKGTWNYRLNVSNQSIKSGVYFIQIISPDNKKLPAGVKLMKAE